MSLRCYRCGESLDGLSLPLSRLDGCPACSVDLHVCRMCAYYVPTAPDGCIEDDAEPVKEKTRANFCDYFTPSPDAFDGSELSDERRARDELSMLFGDETAAGSGPSDREDAHTSDAADDPLAQAHELFKR